MLSLSATLASRWLCAQSGAFGGVSPVSRNAASSGATWAQSHLLAKVAESDSIGDPYPTSPDSTALWLYTSGTTGLPKAAIHRHASIRSGCETYGAQVLGIRPDDRCLSVPKLFFAYGIGNSCFFPLSVGASAVLEPARPTPAG